MSLGVIPLALFLAHATFQDVRCRAVYGVVFVFWSLVMVAGWALEVWELSGEGALLGFGLTWLAGLARGDRYGSAMVGALIGLDLAALSLLIAFAVAFIWWRSYGDERSPADFAFFPFLSAGVGAMVGYHIVESIVR